MGKVRTKAEDKRAPGHSRDAKRPSKGGKGQRDASTVRVLHCFMHTQCVTCFPPDGCLMLLLWRLQVRRLKMYSKTATRDKKGKILHQVRSL